MAAGEAPSTTIDDPLVGACLQMDDWVEEEKEAGQIAIGHHAVQVNAWDSEKRLRGAAIAELPEQLLKEGYSADTGRLRIGKMEGKGTFTFYDAKGRKMRLDVDGTTKDAFLHLTEPLKPGGKLRFVTVGEIEIPER